MEIETTIAKAQVDNVDMPTAGTSYTYNIPAGVKKIRIRLRNPESFGKIGIETDVGTTYFTIQQGTYHEEEIKGGGATLYFRSDNASDTAEILIFK